MVNTPIIVVAYNRPRSIKRILSSLLNSNYNKKEVLLIISIDKGDNQEVQNIANDFIWPFGEKKVYYCKENLGLKRHVLKCGNFAMQYGSVILLEDDLFVSPLFYVYATQSLEFSVDKDYIGGISLYTHALNVNVRRPFVPIDDGFDNWYFQFASSWGQAWTDKQWNDFLIWYKKNSGPMELDEEVPDFITNWPQSSWLKYYIKYLIKANKYFLYPRISLTTNFSDKGTHVGKDNTVFQVPLNNYNYKKFTFSEFDNSSSIYDAFFENIKLNENLCLNKKDICVDLYGYKNNCRTKYYLTSKKLNYLIINSFACSLRPLDLNIIHNICGDDFFLYDTKVVIINNFKTKKNNIRQIVYNIRDITIKDSGSIFLYLLFMRIKNLITTVFSNKSLKQLFKESVEKYNKMKR